MSLALIPVTPELEFAERAVSEDAVMDLARRLIAGGWRINTAFESGHKIDRFTLSGERLA